MMLVAVVLPGGDFFFEGRLVWNAAAQTLARQDAEFGFGHVDRVVAGLLDDVQFDDLLLEQAQTPTREPLGRRRAAPAAAPSPPAPPCAGSPPAPSRAPDLRHTSKRSPVLLMIDPKTPYKGFSLPSAKRGVPSSLSDLTFARRVTV